MSNEYGNNIVVLTDEDGKEIEFEHIDTVEIEGETYLSFIPANLDIEEDAELIILKIDDSGDEELLVSVDDEELLMELYNTFMDRLEDMYEFDTSEE